MRDKATSLHNLNSDRGLTTPTRILWMFYNWLNNRFPVTNLDPGLELRYFNSDTFDEMLSRIVLTDSPARCVSNLFWYSLPWKEVSKKLGGEVRALEVGCGSGIYGELLAECLGDSLELYMGVDLYSHPAWKNFHDRHYFKFEQGDSRSVSEYLDGKNLIITQSAIEHFEEDLDYFRQVADYIKSTDRPVLQIHLMPSASCLYTYLWHGVRHYQPRNLSKITRLFGSETQKHLVSLGAGNCNSVHRKYITYPRLFGGGDQREIKKDDYSNELRKAIEDDMKRPDIKSSCFYALVLESHMDTGITLPSNMFNRT